MLRVVKRVCHLLIAVFHFLFVFYIDRNILFYLYIIRSNQLYVILNNIFVFILIFIGVGIPNPSINRYISLYKL